MVSIDEFVNSLYKGVNGSQKEIKDFKEEMKSHLIETVNELKHEGKTEEDSLKIAFERFGDSTVITNGLFKLFHKQKRVHWIYFNLCYNFFINWSYFIHLYVPKRFEISKRAEDINTGSPRYC